MRSTHSRLFCIVAVVMAAAAMVSAQITVPTPPTTTWTTVVNNGVLVPGDARTFNSYNQPSVNVNGVVVFRARSKGGQSGEPAHGVWYRNMPAGTPLVTLFDRTTSVPAPNNLGSTFIEPPAFARIDMWSNTMASRANHEPVWVYPIGVDLTTRAGTTGVYTNPFGPLIPGANNLGTAPDYGFYGVPPTMGMKFDVFPGAPAVSDKTFIAFKGNFTVGTTGGTGVYYRNMTNSPTGGNAPAVMVADTGTLIPGTGTLFGSTAPPSAAAGSMVFAGFDNEDNPTLGGIYMAKMVPNTTLVPLVKIGQQVPGEAAGAVFNKLGEGLSFDGRFVAFWGAWGDEKKSLTLYCGSEGNKQRVAFCLETYPAGFVTSVPVHQGIFVYDTKTFETYAVAKSPNDFDDFVYWNFSGLVPGTGESDETGEPARWRSASFAAVSGLVDGKLSDATYHATFKARKGTFANGGYSNIVDGIYLRRGPGDEKTIMPLVQTGMDGTLIDKAAIYADEETGLTTNLPVTEMGLERDGFRGYWLTINVSMGTEEAGWAGIYMTQIPK